MSWLNREVLPIEVVLKMGCVRSIELLKIAVERAVQLRDVFGDGCTAFTSSNIFKISSTGQAS
jgi:hypothetical protein